MRPVKLTAALLSLLLLSACAAPGGSSSGTGSVVIQTAVCASSSAADPDWAAAREGSVFRLDNVDLDGVGAADDSACASVYAWGTDAHGQDSEMTVLRVRLGTGQTLVRLLPGPSVIEQLTAVPVFSPDRCALVLECEVPYSNYGAANLYVFDVTAAAPADLWDYFNSPYVTPLTQLVPLAQSSLQTGVRFTPLGDTGRCALTLPLWDADAKATIPTSLYWNDQTGDWAILS